MGGREFLEEIRRQERVAGWEQPQRRALAPRPSWEAVVKAMERVRGEKWEAFRDRHGDWGREAALYLGRTRSGMRLRELGASVGGADYAAVSAAIKRFGLRLKCDRSLGKNTETLGKLLNVET